MRHAQNFSEKKKKKKIEDRVNFYNYIAIENAHSSYIVFWISIETWTWCKQMHTFCLCTVESHFDQIYMHKEREFECINAEIVDDFHVFLFKNCRILPNFNGTHKIPLFANARYHRYIATHWMLIFKCIEWWENSIIFDVDHDVKVILFRKAFSNCFD